MAERLIKIQYSGPGLHKVTSAASIQGALRASMIRLYEEQYVQAMVYDLRYGGVFGENRYLALTLTEWRTSNPSTSWPREMVEQGQLASNRLSAVKQRLDAAMDDYVRNNP